MQQIEIEKYIAETIQTLERSRGLAKNIQAGADELIKCLQGRGKVIFCGNGGSAADAQHLSAELMGRFLVDRSPLPALSLTVDTSALTAIGNDYGYDQVFARQLRGIAREGDVLFGMSTSGNSGNVVEAFKVARGIGVRTIGLTGEGGGAMAELSDVLIAVPHTKTNHVQEAHITIGHMICAIVEVTLCSHKL